LVAILRPEPGLQGVRVRFCREVRVIPADAAGEVGFDCVLGEVQGFGRSEFAVPADGVLLGAAEVLEA
jgi:hypothetical protein